MKSGLRLRDGEGLLAGELGRTGGKTRRIWGRGLCRAGLHSGLRVVSAACRLPARAASSSRRPAADSRPRDEGNDGSGDDRREKGSKAIHDLAPERTAVEVNTARVSGSRTSGPRAGRDWPRIPEKNCAPEGVPAPLTIEGPIQ